MTRTWLEVTVTNDGWVASIPQLDIEARNADKEAAVADAMETARAVARIRAATRGEDAPSVAFAVDGEDVSDGPPAANAPPAQRHAEMLDRKNKLEADLLRVKAEIAASEPGVLEWFASVGVDSVRLPDGRSLFLRRELWASRADDCSPEQAIAALESAGLGELVAPKINAQGLSAYCRELDRAGQPLPPALSGHFKVIEQFKIGTRRGTSARGGTE